MATIQERVYAIPTVGRVYEEARSARRAVGRKARGLALPDGRGENQDAIDDLDKVLSDSATAAGKAVLQALGLFGF